MSKTKKIKLTVLIAVLAALASPFIFRAVNNYSTPPIFSVVEADAVKIEGTIRNLEKETKKFNNLVRSGKKEIFILINSGGGRVDIGMQLISRIHAASHVGVEVNCIVDGRAGSMALIILSQCPNRYGMFGSSIMWHSASQGLFGAVNEKSAFDIMENLRILNDTIWADVRMYFWPWYFKKNYESERFIPVSEIEQNSFGFMKVLTSITITKPDGKSLEVKKIGKKK